MILLLSKLKKFKMSISTKKLNKEYLTKLVESTYLKPSIPKISVGDVIKVGLKIKEGNKERIQFFEGLVISKKNSGIQASLIIRKFSNNIGVEKTILLHSPRVDSIKIIKSSKVRRAKLYYIRTLFGKAAKLKQRFN